MFFHLRRLNFCTLFTRRFSRYLITQVSFREAMRLSEAFFRLFLVTTYRFLLNFSRRLKAGIFLYICSCFRIQARLFRRLLFTTESQAKGGRQYANVISRRKISLVSSNMIIFTLCRIIQTSHRVIARVIRARFIIHARYSINVMDNATNIKIQLILISAICQRSIRRVWQTRPFQIAF